MHDILRHMHIRFRLRNVLINYNENLPIASKCAFYDFMTYLVYCLFQQLKFPEEKRESPVADAINLPSTLNPIIEPADSAPSTSDNTQKTVPPVTGEISRKHHRAWTLSEVMKLVEGVSRFGAGKWSEIKRLSFTSYPYRTSVDLKVMFLQFFVDKHVSLSLTVFHMTY